MPGRDSLSKGSRGSRDKIGSGSLRRFCGCVVLASSSQLSSVSCHDARSMCGLMPFDSVSRGLVLCRGCVWRSVHSIFVWCYDLR